MRMLEGIWCWGRHSRHPFDHSYSWSSNFFIAKARATGVKRQRKATKKSGASKRISKKTSKKSAKRSTKRAAPAAAAAPVQASSAQATPQKAAKRSTKKAAAKKSGKKKAAPKRKWMELSEWYFIYVQDLLIKITNNYSSLHLYLSLLFLPPV